MPKGERPHTWLYPDPVEHKQHIAYNRMKAQAAFRSEPFELTFRDFQTAWSEHWHERGRRQHEYCLIRKDPDEPWALGNVETMQRQEHFKTRTRRS